MAKAVNGMQLDINFFIAYFNDNVRWSPVLRSYLHVYPKMTQDRINGINELH